MLDIKENKLFFLILIASGLGIIIFHLFFHTQSEMTGMRHSEQIDKGQAIKSLSKNTVIIKKYEFTPGKITVKKGTIVKWVNEDIAPHTVTVDNSESTGPKSKLFGKGKSYEFKFEIPGIYQYHCEPHPYMKGLVEVTE